MEIKNQEETIQNTDRRIALPAGILLITTGAIILADQTLQTGWLSQVTVAAAGILLLASGIHLKKLLLMTFGCLFTGISIGSLLAMQPNILPTWGGRIGAGLASLSFSWILLFPMNWYITVEGICW